MATVVLSSEHMPAPPTWWQGQVGRFVFIAVICCSLLCGGNSDAQTWTKVQAPAPFFSSGIGTMVLMTDGTVLVQGAENTNRTSAQWAKLTPNSKGSYVLGTWNSVSPMNVERVNFATWVVPSGNLVVAGGEFVNTPFTGNPYDATLEQYDPATDTWTMSQTTFPGGLGSSIGPAPSVMLPNGFILFGSHFGQGTYLYNPAADFWTPTGGRLNETRSSGETWTLLPNGNVITYDSAGSAGVATFSEKYNPVSGNWSDAGAVPIKLNSFVETTGVGVWHIGPASVLPNGKVIQFGTKNQSVIYDPATSTWALGPSFAAGRGTDSAPAAMLPNGQMMIATSAVPGRGAPTRLYAYDYTQPVLTALTDVTPVSPNALVNDLVTFSGFVRRLLVLPNGNMLMSTGSNTLWEYTPPPVAGNPQASWAPTITNVVAGPSSTYTLTGTRLNGISTGGNFGGSYNNSVSNFPVIRLTNAAGLVRFAKPSNWTPGISAPGDATAASVQFTLPSGLPVGTYQLSVVANGIPSANWPFVISTPTGNFITYAYDSIMKTLTLTGDANDNAMQITVKSGTVTLQGGGDTKFGTLANSTPTVTIHYGGDLKIIGTFSGGNDSIVITSLNSTNVNLDLGTGDDTVKFTYCNIAKTTIVGGLGNDTIVKTGSKLSSYTLSGVEAQLPP